MSECLVMDGVEIKKVTGMGTTPVALEAPSMHHRPRNDLANRSSAEFASASLGKRPLASQARGQSTEHGWYVECSARRLLTSVNDNLHLKALYEHSTDDRTVCRSNIAASAC